MDCSLGNFRRVTSAGINSDLDFQVKASLKVITTIVVASHSVVAGKVHRLTNSVRPELVLDSTILVVVGLADFATCERIGPHLLGLGNDWLDLVSQPLDYGSSIDCCMRLLTVKAASFV